MKKFITLLFLTLIPNFFYSRERNYLELCITSNDSYTSTNRDYSMEDKPSMSLWYQLCFTSSGTFEFYINPSGNKNNFDFTIWDNTTTYPPTTSPIRYSRSAILPSELCDTCDCTGLGNGAIDLSESVEGDGWLLPLTVTKGQCIIINISNYDSDSNNLKIYLGGTAMALPISLIDFYTH